MTLEISVDEIDVVGASEVPPSGSLRQQTFWGMIWMVGQSVCTKLVAVVGQIALAYILLPDDFAAISLTYTVTAFARILESAGLREVLVHRGNDFYKWSNSGFWLSLLFGAISSILIVVSAPIAANIYQSDLVKSLLYWLAVTPIISALSVVPLAILQSQHRFRALAGLAASFGVTQIVATVVFAFFGYGAYSFVFGTIVASLINTTVAWWIATPSIQLGWELEKWKSLWNDTLSLTLVGLATTVIQQIDYMMLGMFQPKELVGYYFFAFGIATQTTQMISGNISSVFLPILCKMQSDPIRQLAASVNALQVLAAIGIPLSFLQCGVTQSGFEIFLPEKWKPAIPYAQVLSLGLGLNLLSSLCWSLLKSQGRFRTILYMNTVSAVIFSTAVAFGAAHGTPLTVALLVAALCGVYSPTIMWLAFRRIGGNWGTVANVFLAPLVLSAISLAVAWQVEAVVGAISSFATLRFLSVGCAFSVVYLIGLMVVKHPLLADVVGWLRKKNVFHSAA